MQDDSGLLSVMSQFGGAPAWSAINTAYADVNQDTGQVWVPPGLLMANYTEVRVNYVAGFSSSGIPDAIKLAAAKIIDAQVKTPLNGNIKLMKAGDTQLERFIDATLDNETRKMLSVYRARAYA
jgi:hypothetical protein